MLIGIVSDIHNKTNKANKIIKFLKNLPVNDIILLGDYVDDFGDSDIDMSRVLHWIGECQKDPQIKMLIGNHEASYMCPQMRCSGWSSDKQWAWNKAVLTKVFDPTQFQAAIVRDGYYFTHAGIHKNTDFEIQIKLVEDLIYNNTFYYRFDYHRFDGGENQNGSILTGRHKYTPLDLKYFQVCGHTPHENPVIHYDNGTWKAVELDTNLKHFMVLDTDSHSIEIYDAKTFKMLEYEH